MKRILQKRSWILFCGVAGIGAVVLYFLGFRITYAPELENSWNAISACASWIGVIASAYAVIVAIRIPKEIADRQDKIALFEKRFAFYDVLSRCISYARIIENAQTHQELQIFFVASFGREKMGEYAQDSLDRDVLRLESEATTVLKQGVFLFDFDEAKQVKPLISSLISLLSIREDHSRFWECYRDYMKAVKDAQEVLLPKVEHSISIGK